jgi:hypothetical protein
VTREKRNCWEVKRCGRQPGGESCHEFGVCPAAMEKRLDGIHGGVNAGRACWVVSGTMCRSSVQGTFAKKFSDCRNCDFYESVKSDEAPLFRLSATLLALL